jgi:hypothetical protein
MMLVLKGIHAVNLGKHCGGEALDLPLDVGLRHALDLKTRVKTTTRHLPKSICCYALADREDACRFADEENFLINWERDDLGRWLGIHHAALS